MDTEDLSWLDQIAEDYASRIRAGGNPSLDLYVQLRPDLETQIREILGMAGTIESAKIFETRRTPTASSLVPSLRGYQIRKELGRGGMGIVYEADDLTLHRRVALKVLAPHLCRDPKSVERFQKEARAAGRLQHPNIVSIHKVSDQVDEPIYFTMPLVDGIGFDRVIDRLRCKVDLSNDEAIFSDRSASDLESNRSSSSLSVTLRELNQGRESTGRLLKSSHRYFHSVAKLGQQIANALAYAHSRGILHRDIKPSNILLDSNGTAWVSDFGLAKDMDDEGTATGDLVGTIRYMAPERFQGKYDARTDIYGLGLILYELVSLQPAFAQLDRAELLDSIQNRPVKDVVSLEPRVPKDLNTIIAKCLSYSPASRYASAAELSADLQRFVDNQPIRAKAVGPFERCYKAALRYPSLTALIIVLAVASAVTTFLWRRTEWSRSSENQVRARLEKLVYARDIELADTEFHAQNMEQCKLILDRCAPELRQWEWHFLRQRINQPIWSSPNNSQLISSVALSNGGNLVAYGFGAMGQNSPEPISVWDTKTNRLLYELKDLEECQITDLEFSPDGELLVAGCVIWDMSNSSGVNRRGGVRAWSLADGSLRWSWTKVDVMITRFSSDGSSVFIGAASGPLVAINSKDGRETHSYTGSRGTLLDMKLSPDQKQIAACTRDGVISIWNVNEEKFTKQLSGMGDTRHLVWSPNQDRLFVSNYLGEQLTLDIRGKSLSLTDIHSQANRHRDVFETSPDHSWIVASSYDRPIEFFDAKRQSVQFQIPAHGGRTRAIAFEASGRLLATGGADGFVHLWDLTASDRTKNVSPLPQAFPISIDSSPSSNELAVAMSKREARAERFSGKPRIEILDAKDYRIKKTFFGHSDWLTTVSYNKHGTHVVSGSRDASVRVWDVATGKQTAIYNGHVGAIRTAEFAVNASSIISSDETGNLCKWDVTNSNEIWTFDCQEDIAAVLNVHERHTMAILRSGKIAIVDTRNGKLVHQYQLNERVRSAAVDDIGNQFVVGTESGKLAFASIAELLARRDPVLALLAVPSEAISMDFNLSGNRLLVGHQDESVRLYDTELHLELLCVESLKGVVMQTKFSRFGDDLLIAQRYHILQFQLQDQNLDSHSDQAARVAWHKDRIEWCNSERLHASSAFHYSQLRLLEPNNVEHCRAALINYFNAGLWQLAKRELDLIPLASYSAIEDGLFIRLNLILGDRADAIKHLEWVSGRLDQSTTPEINSLAWHCAFDQELVHAFPKLALRLEEAVNKSNSPLPAWFTTMAMVCYRQHRYEDAIQYSYESLKDKKIASYPINWLIVAMCRASIQQGLTDRSTGEFRSSASPKKSEDTLLLFQRWKQTQENKLFAGDRLSSDFEALNNTDFRFLLLEFEQLRKK